MDVSHSTWQDMGSQVGVSSYLPHSAPSDHFYLKSYDRVLSIVLSAIRKSDMLVQGAPKPWSF